MFIKIGLYFNVVIEFKDIGIVKFVVLKIIKSGCKVVYSVIIF